jgi:hypothetical protein
MANLTQDIESVRRPPRRSGSAAKAFSVVQHQSLQADGGDASATTSTKLGSSMVCGETCRHGIGGLPPAAPGQRLSSTNRVISSPSPFWSASVTNRQGDQTQFRMPPANQRLGDLAAFGVERTIG